MRQQLLVEIVIEISNGFVGAFLPLREPMLLLRLRLLLVLLLLLAFFVKSVVYVVSLPRTCSFHYLILRSNLDVRRHVDQVAQEALILFLCGAV